MLPIKEASLHPVTWAVVVQIRRMNRLAGGWCGISETFDRMTRL